MSDASETDLEELPSMAEKVKFWEEQDKINQALIPRVIEMADQLESLSKELAKINDRISNTEARVLERVEESREKRLEEIEANLQEMNRALSRIQQDDEGDDMPGEIDDDLRRVKLIAQVSAVISITVAIALLAILLSTA